MASRSARPLPLGGRRRALSATAGEKRARSQRPRARHVAAMIHFRRARRPPPEWTCRDHLSAFHVFFRRANRADGAQARSRENAVHRVIIARAMGRTCGLGTRTRDGQRASCGSPVHAGLPLIRITSSPPAIIYSGRARESPPARSHFRRIRHRIRSELQLQKTIIRPVAIELIDHPRVRGRDGAFG